MKIRNEFVICSSIDPQGRRLFVEVTKLLLLQALFYDSEHSTSDEVVAEEGWLTVVGSKVYRVRMIDPAAVDIPASVGSDIAFFRVDVNWEDLDTKPEALQ